MFGADAKYAEYSAPLLLHRWALFERMEATIGDDTLVILRLPARFEFQGRVIDLLMRAAVVLPPSYHHTLRRTYAALYRNHGFGGDHTAA